MKKKTTTMFVALTLVANALLSSISLADENDATARARSLYQQGVIAMNQGKYELAQMSFKEVLRIYPKHTQARKHLIYISSNKKSLETKRRKVTLKRVMIPKVNFENATITEALNVLTVQVERASKGKVTPNFIVQDSNGAFKNSRVNLRLNNIPAETLLRYIVDQTGGNVRYDKHAIVITPRKKAVPAPQKTSAGFGN